MEFAQPPWCDWRSHFYRPIKCFLSVTWHPPWPIKTSLVRPEARSSSHRCPMFCYGLQVERHISWKRRVTVWNRVWDTFYLVWWVCQKCQPNQNWDHSHNGSKWSHLICVCCSSVYATIEDIWRHVCHKRFIVTAYQHDDGEFVSKCN